ncbi:hypothetical protein FS837_005868 [Tulasnella sp. UAMH 9824]|nr:hypothetical protein FS837_005868 [Tulasnella sp. UAMH 9824]
MSGIPYEHDEPNRSTSGQEAVIDQVEVAMNRLRISPKKALVSVSHLRIDRARIKSIKGQAPKAGGNADVEAAILAPVPSSTPSESDDAEYVAVKKLRFDEDTHDDRALAPLAHEVILLNDLSHENVVKIIGFVEEAEQGVAWMVFVWEKNGNLREFIRSAKWELPERVSLINDVAKGLGYLHGRNPPICHGDLKSSRAVITDFGSARAMGLVDEGAPKDIGAAEATSPSDPAGTGTQDAEALSAEIAPSGDFITMTGPAWTAVTGSFPFDKENDTAVVLHIVKGDLPTIENDDQLNQIKALCSLMRECWKLDMGERPTALRCQQVVGWMDQAVPLPNEGNSSGVTRSSGLLYALGRVQQMNDMYTEALEYFEQSLKSAESVGDGRGRARALSGTGDTFILQDEYSKAQESYIQARDISSQIDDQNGFAYSVNGLGDVYNARAEYSNAEESYMQARNIYSQTGERLGFARSVKSLGEVYYLQAEYTKAGDALSEAREIYSQIGNQLGFAQSVKSLADVFRNQEEYSKAEELYAQARETYSQIGDHLGVAQSVDSLGDLYQMREEYSKAEESYIQARDIYSQVGNQLGLAQSLEGIGQLHSTREEYVKAEESYSEAQRIYHQIGDTFGLANISWYLGWLHRKQEKYSAAERCVREASAIYDELGLTQDVKQCDDFLEEIKQLM